MVKAKELKLLRKALDQYHKSTNDPLDELLPVLLLDTTGSTANDGIEKEINPSEGVIHPTTFRNNTSKFRIVTTNAKENRTSPKISSTTTTDSKITVGTENVHNEAMMHHLSISTSTSAPPRNQNKEDSTYVINNNEPNIPLTVRYYRTLPNDLLLQCLQLFHNNMKSLYETSTWGYNIDEKQQELEHPHARFIIITAASVTNDSDHPNTAVVAFVHYRYCYDDDDDPNMLVLYIYEMQVQKQYQKQGIGQYCMDLMELIASHGGTTQTSSTVLATATTKEQKTNVTKKSGPKKKAVTASSSSINHGTTTTTTASPPDVQKIMLTVFRQNTSAMQFYRTKLHYTIDATSPSQYNQVTDYEILSKSVVSM